MAVSKKSLNNLKKITDMTPEEKSEFGKKGAKARTEKQRKKKQWKEIATIMLSSPASAKNKELLKKYNIDDEDADINAMIVYQLIVKAMSGDLNAIRELKEITGNKEAENVNLNVDPILIKVEDDYGE